MPPPAGGIWAVGGVSSLARLHLWAESIKPGCLVTVQLVIRHVRRRVLGSDGQTGSATFWLFEQVFSSLVAALRSFDHVFRCFVDTQEVAFSARM